ncbi:MAG: flagellar hook capping protein [Microbacteriaceae bacterium]|nr:flagellar hook capping protein [Microbacteriaceae bacterium]
MTINPVASTTAPSMYATTSTRTPSQTLDSTAFMNLLVTQLKNQDPSSPMDTNAMIGQTTQLAMMEQLTNMNTTGTESFALQMRIAASSMIGQQVGYTDPNGKPVTGTASSVSFSGSVPTVTINGVEVALDTITGVTATGATTP